MSLLLLPKTQEWVIMLPADKIQNVEHAQLQRNIEMLNKKENL